MEKLQVNLVIEIMGRPKEHVKESLINLIMKMATEKGIRILNKTIHEPMPIKDSADLFSSFAEVSVELDSIVSYIAIIFGYMPSHIELVRPEEVVLSNTNLNELGNVLVQRLHQYDAIAKNTMVEKDILMKKLYEVAPHLFKKPDGSVPPIDRLQAQAPKTKGEKKGKKTKGKKK